MRAVTLLLTLTAVFPACSDVPFALNGPGPGSESANSPAFAAAGPIEHSVYVGGPDVCGALGLPTACDADFALQANLLADGRVVGSWHDMFAGGAGIGVKVLCLNVVDNGAVLSGIIELGLGTIFGKPGSDFVGTAAIVAVVDNGTTANDPPDQISFSLFPRTEGLDNCYDFVPSDFRLWDLTKGQVVVR